MACAPVTPDALQILDPWSRSTLAVTLNFPDGPTVEAGVPSGTGGTTGRDARRVSRRNPCA